MGKRCKVAQETRITIQNGAVLLYGIAAPHFQPVALNG